MDTSTLIPAPALPAWSVAGRLLDALTRRDLVALGDCLDPAVRFRALVPPGRLDFDNAADVVAKFTAWFSGPDRFEVVDASLGQIGPRLALRWRIRMWPDGEEASARVVEQLVYATGSERIEAMDLLCSGFHSERAVAACPLP